MIIFIFQSWENLCRLAKATLCLDLFAVSNTPGIVHFYLKRGENVALCRSKVLFVAILRLESTAFVTTNSASTHSTNGKIFKMAFTSSTTPVVRVGSERFSITFCVRASRSVFG